MRTHRTMLIAATVMLCCAHPSTARVSERSRLSVIEFVGARDLGIRNIEQRLQKNGLSVRPGSPEPTGRVLCEIKEIIGDMMAEKGYPDATITHEVAENARNVGTVTLVFTIEKGALAQQAQRPNPLTPAGATYPQSCSTRFEAFLQLSMPSFASAPVLVERV